MSVTDLLAALDITLLERGWLSSNNVLFAGPDDVDCAVVDSGYVDHEAQTLALVESWLGDRRLGRIVNTHLHSDHCGGNQILAERFGARVLVPEACLDAVSAWDQSALSFALTEQDCRQFSAQEGLRAGSAIALGRRCWDVVAAPGHDPTALMFFEPQSRVLISGDALWEHRLAIIFPELEDLDGFEQATESLDVIERLQPTLVIPGHGPAFEDVAGAIARSRQRLLSCKRDPQRHRLHAAKALVMFRLMSKRTVPRHELLSWLSAVPVLTSVWQRWPESSVPTSAMASSVLDDLLRGGLLVESADVIRMAG